MTGALRRPLSATVGRKCARCRDGTLDKGDAGTGRARGSTGEAQDTTAGATGNGDGAGARRRPEAGRRAYDGGERAAGIGGCGHLPAPWGQVQEPTT